jgi:D-alanine--poly(phosphoribitol) ligase subunit 2
MTSTAEKTLRILAEVADTPRVLTEPDLPIFDLGLLDSLGTVTLIAQLSEEFGVDISPAEFERKDWATPAKLVQDMERRAGA